MYSAANLHRKVVDSCGMQTCSGGSGTASSAEASCFSMSSTSWKSISFYNTARSGNWYDFGFLLGAGSPLMSALGKKHKKR